MTITYENAVHLKELGLWLFDEDLPDMFGVLNSSGADIATNQAVHCFDGLAGPEMRLADSSAAYDYPVTGFTKAAVTAGQKGDVRIVGQLKGFSGLTPLQKYYSDPANPGGICEITGITVTGQKEQLVGFAVGADILFIFPWVVIKRLTGATALRRKDGYLEEISVGEGEGEVVFQDGVLPPTPLLNEDEDDWLYG